VSRQLVRAVNGDIRLAAERSPLGGARFVIVLPKVKSTERCHDGTPREDTRR